MNKIQVESAPTQFLVLQCERQFIQNTLKKNFFSPKYKTNFPFFFFYIKVLKLIKGVHEVKNTIAHLRFLVFPE